MASHLDPPEQGALVHGCPYCRILYPDTRPCPRCGGDTRFQPEQMLDAEGVARAVERAAERFEVEPSRASLEALLRLLLVHAPLGRRALEARRHPVLDDLRLADRMLLPDLIGRSAQDVRADFGDPDREAPGEWTYQARGPAHHHRLDTVLRLEEGRVVEQRARRVKVACEHDPPA